MKSFLLATLLLSAISSYAAPVLDCGNGNKIHFNEDEKTLVLSDESGEEEKNQLHVRDIGRNISEYYFMNSEFFFRFFHDQNEGQETVALYIYRVGMFDIPSDTIHSFSHCR